MKQTLIILFVLICSVSFGQELTKEQSYKAKKHLKEGNTLFQQGKYEEAGKAYEKSLQQNSMYYKGAYNQGNALFLQKKFKEASDQYALANKLAKTKLEKAKTKELMGDSFIAQKDLEKAQKAYKEALLKNPTDDVLRQKYIATIQAKQQQDQQNKDNKDNKDKKNKDQDQKNQDQKDKGDNKKDGDQDSKDQKDGDQNKDQSDKEKEGDQKGNKGDQDKDEKKDSDQKNQEGDNKKDEQNKDQDQQKGSQGDQDQQDQEGTQPRKSKLTPAEIQQLLESMSNEEQKTQKKVSAQKVKAKVRKNEKDW